MSPIEDNEKPQDDPASPIVPIEEETEAEDLNPKISGIAPPTDPSDLEIEKALKEMEQKEPSQFRAEVGDAPPPPKALPTIVALKENLPRNGNNGNEYDIVKQGALCVCVKEGTVLNADKPEESLLHLEEIEKDGTPTGRRCFARRHQVLKVRD